MPGRRGSSRAACTISSAAVASPGQTAASALATYHQPTYGATAAGSAAASRERSSPSAASNWPRATSSRARTMRSHARARARAARERRVGHRHGLVPATETEQRMRGIALEQRPERPRDAESLSLGDPLPSDIQALADAAGHLEHRGQVVVGEGESGHMGQRQRDPPCLANEFDPRSASPRTTSTQPSTPSATASSAGAPTVLAVSSARSPPPRPGQGGRRKEQAGGMGLDLASRIVGGSVGIRRTASSASLTRLRDRRHPRGTSAASLEDAPPARDRPPDRRRQRLSRQGDGALRLAHQGRHGGRPVDDARRSMGSRSSA